MYVLSQLVLDMGREMSIYKYVANSEGSIPELLPPHFLKFFTAKLQENSAVQSCMVDEVSIYCGRDKCCMWYSHTSTMHLRESSSFRSSFLFYLFNSMVDGHDCVHFFIFNSKTCWKFETSM